MERKTLFKAIGLIVGAAACLPMSVYAFERTEEREPCDSYEKFRQPLFGDFHLHTGLSYDASLRFVRPFPRDAYAFAKGEPVTRTGAAGLVDGEYQIERPLDFGAVTDHSEHFGEVGLCYDIGGINQPGKYSLDCQLITGFLYEATMDNKGNDLVIPAGVQRGMSAAFFVPLSLQNDIAQSRGSKLPVCNSGEGDCDATELAVWGEMQAAAEEAYDRSSDCEFTSFIAYENSSSPASVNWHRNVIFRNDRVVERPVTAIDMAQVIPNTDPNNQRPIYSPPGPEPKLMWDRFQEECLDAGNGCDVVTIPHNPNLGGGIQLPDGTQFADPLFFNPRGETEAEQKAYAEQRARFEPLVEMYQHKGSSECRYDPRFADDENEVPGVNTSDELCDFELLETSSILDASGIGAGSGAGTTPPSGFPNRSYIRNILKDGIGYQKSLGANPFKLGFISSTDSHNATMGNTPESAWSEDNPTGFGGHLGIEDSAPTIAPQNSSGGNVGVWAEENSRDSIFEALKRKETFATSGTRIAPRFFGGYNFSKNMCQQNFVKKGYKKGVPMGGDLPSPNGNGKKAPSFLVQATYDDFIGTPLQQLQVIKGWVDAEGETHEAVYTVAGDADNGASVNEETCEPEGTGFEELCTVWEDPDFDASEHAFYYARVIENPVCRFSTRWCKDNYGINPMSETCSEDLEQYLHDNPGADPEEVESCCLNQETIPIVQPVIQERAWTSPIWHTPS